MNHAASLVRNEIDLAKAEAREAARSAVTGLVLIVVAVIIAICALNVLTAALVAAVAAGFGIGGGWASLAVGVVYLVIGLILVLVARRKLDPSNLSPQPHGSECRTRCAGVEGDNIWLITIAPPKRSSAISSANVRG